MADIASNPADGKVNVWWVTTISSTTAPTVAEIGAGTEITEYITADGFSLTTSEQTVSDDRLSDTATYEQPGRHQRSLELTYIDNTNGSGLSNDAKTTLVPATAGYVVVRRGLAKATAVAAAQKVTVIPAKCGQYQDQPPEANSVLKTMQKVFVTGATQVDVAVAA